MAIYLSVGPNRGPFFHPPPVLVLRHFFHVCRSPGFLTLSVTDNLEPKLWWLRDKLDVSLDGAAKILTTYPNLFGLSIEANLEPKLW